MPKEYYSEDGRSWISYDKKDPRNNMPRSKSSKRKYHEAYETAFYTAGERSGRRGGRGRRDKDDDDMEEGVIVAITAVVSIAVTVLIFSLVLYCLRKRRREDTVSQNVNELSSVGNPTPVHQQQLPNDSIQVTNPSVLAPGEKGNSDNVYLP